MSSRRLNVPLPSIKRRCILVTILMGCFFLLTLTDGFFEVIFLGLLAGGCLYAIVQFWTKAECAAANFEKRYQISAESCHAIPYGILVFDAEGHCQFTNNLARRLFPGEEITSFADFAAHFAEHRKMLEAIKSFSKETEHGHMQYLDVPMAIHGNDLLWWRVTAVPMPRFLGWTLWSFADLTPAARRLDVPEANPIFLLELLQSTPMGYFTINSLGKVVFCNRTFARWLGMKRSEIVGTLYRELFTDASCDSLPMIDGLGRFMRSPTVLMALDGREGSRQVAVQQIFIREDWRTYSAFFAESASLSSQTVPDKISHFMRIVENAPLGILAIDETAHITFCNSAFCAFLNETQHKVIGKALLTYIDERYHDVVSDHLQEYTATQPQTGKMFEAALMGEESRSVLFYIGALERPSLNDPSGVTGVPLVLYVIDVTQNRRLEEQLTQSQKMQAIGQLAGSIAHDFNNLLTAMIGYCDLLLGRYSPADQSFTDVMQIKQNANRASHLVRQLLAFSRKQTLQPKVLDITDIVSELSALLQRLLGVKIDLRITYGRDLRLVRVDPIQLEQVIINISVNARDAMPDGGALTIKTYAYKTIKSVLTEGDIMPPGQYTVVEMQDTGIGIKAKDLPYIFDPFYSTKQKGAGTGLGLATVYGIVKQTGGFIKVSSIKDKGTTFSVFFPAYEGHEQPERTTYDFSVSRTLSRDLTGTGTILLVEDEEAVRLFSARALRNKGYTVVDVEDGEAALTYLQAHLNDPIDLLITDVMMPKMDGPTLMKEVRKTHPDLKVIFVSGYTQDKFRQDLGQGAHLQFLSKPFDIKELAEKVKGVLGMKNFS